MSKFKNSSQLIKKLYLSSCFEEIYYLKPGNVSVKSKTISSLSTEQAIESISITGGKCKKILKVTYKLKGRKNF